MIAEVSTPRTAWRSRLWGVEFFCYHRDRPGSVRLREELLEEHLSYMDRYQAEMIARGPTLAGDGATPTGSVHIVDLPGPAAARAFAFDEREEAIGPVEWAAALERADPDRRPVRKTRHVVPHGAQSLEIDVFEEPAGLVVVEVELGSEDEAVELPAWLGEWREVTGDQRYFNASLARRGAEVPPFD